MKDDTFDNFDDYDSSTVIDDLDEVDYGAGVDGDVHAPEPLSTEAKLIERCAHDRVFFAEIVLGIVLEQWQYDVLTALDKGATRVSIRSGNGAGKTCLVAIIVIHYLLFRNDVKIPVTAPASSQLKDGLIPECHKWINELPDFLRTQLDTTADRIVRRDSPANNFISFRTARKENPEALQGIHAQYVLCAVDEASAVPDSVYEAAQGTMSTPGSIFLMISNPTRLSGYFYNSHHRSKKEWRTFHVTSFDTSRVDQSFVDQIANEYGESSDQYKVKVLGEFPSREEQALIERKLVVAAFARDIVCTGEDVIMGVDVGRGGDLSALCFREGNWAYGFKTQNYSDTMQTVGWVKDAYDKAKVKPAAVHVDSIGIGAGVADRLTELGVPCVAINVSESPSMKSQYVRLRDELWWQCKIWLESLNVRFDGLSPAMQDMLEAELCAPLSLFTSTGKNGVESKQQLRQRGYRSPNLADALCLTFAFDSTIASGAYGASNSTWKKPMGFEPIQGIW